MSKPIDVCRGCRQGDPIAAYLFILAAEILKLLIDKDPQITGIKVGKHIFKVAQFADDTTLFLDGTSSSLQASLNVLETFGNFSGLKMNSEKTKTIWIGQKRHSKDKLNVGTKLNWGETKFTLLGLKFSTNLNEMPDMNYQEAMLQTQKIFNSWKSRSLTPIVRITIIKTLVLPKFNHLFASLPSPRKLLDKLNKSLYDYLWLNKPDKIKRSTICQPYDEGGLKMVDLFNFEKSVKLNWIRRIIDHKNISTCWFKLMSVEIQHLDSLVTFGDEWIKKFTPKLNPFWKEVFKNWSSFCKNLKVKSNQDILHSSLWFNSQISKKEMFFPDWSLKGIKTVADLLDPDGNVITIESLRKTYKFTPNILNYYTMKSLTSNFVKRYRNGNNFTISRPFVPFHSAILLSPNCRSKSFYQTLLETDRVEPCNKSKWDTELRCTMTDNDWKLIHRSCFRTIFENSLIWLQYRILHRIIGTYDYMYKMKISDSNLCGLCKIESETIIHLFSECIKVKDLWKNICTWVESKINLKINLTHTIKTLGYFIQDEHFWPLNFILIVTRKYIFTCSKKENNLNIYHLQKMIKERFQEQESLCKVSMRHHTFENNWIVWKHIFKNI